MIPRSLLPKALSLLLLCLAPGSGSAQQGAREAMADAMSRMMDAMGLFDSERARQTPGNASTDPMSMSDPLLPSSWASAFREKSGDWNIPWTPSQLEGIWEGRNGELLIVQGSRFRIYSPQMQRLDGLIQIQGTRLALYNPLNGNAQPFEFSQSGSRLVMRDLAGQVYLYRRLRLDGGQPPAASWSSRVP